MQDQIYKIRLSSSLGCYYYIITNKLKNYIIHYDIMKPL